MVLTFGDDQKGFKLQFATDEGKEICAKVSTTPLADEPSGWAALLTAMVPCCAGRCGRSRRSWR